MMRKPSMRLVFQDEELKEDLQDLAQELELSLNSLVNYIVAAELSKPARDTLNLLKDVAEYKKYFEGNDVI